MKADKRKQNIREGIVLTIVRCGGIRVFACPWTTYRGKRTMNDGKDSQCGNSDNGEQLQECQRGFQSLPSFLFSLYPPISFISFQCFSTLSSWFAFLSSLPLSLQEFNRSTKRSEDTLPRSATFNGIDSHIAFHVYIHLYTYTWFTNILRYEFRELGNEDSNFKISLHQVSILELVFGEIKRWKVKCSFDYPPF